MKTNQKTQTTPLALQTSDLVAVRKDLRISDDGRPQGPPPVHQPSTINHQLKTRHLIGIICLLAFCTGCQVLTYHSPTGERFTRSSLGSATAIKSLSVESGTNGLRRVELRGYQNDSTEALGTVTEAAVRAALESVK